MGLAVIALASAALDFLQPATGESDTLAFHPWSNSAPLPEHIGAGQCSRVHVYRSPTAGAQHQLLGSCKVAPSEHQLSPHNNLRCDGQVVVAGSGYAERDTQEEVQTSSLMCSISLIMKCGYDVCLTCQSSEPLQLCISCPRAEVLQTCLAAKCDKLCFYRLDDMPNEHRSIAGVGIALILIVLNIPAANVAGIQHCSLLRRGIVEGPFSLACYNTCAVTLRTHRERERASCSQAQVVSCDG
eukprot:2911728-Amphidinium_carterae.2